MENVLHRSNNVVTFNLHTAEKRYIILSFPNTKLQRNISPVRSFYVTHTVTAVKCERFWKPIPLTVNMFIPCGWKKKKRNEWKPAKFDDDKSQTLNHMFLLKLSDRADEDLWGCWIFVLSSLALAWMCPGTVSTNSNTAGLLGEIHLPSLGMPKRLWRCNSLILRREQCSSYCYGKSMWLSWRTASEDSFLRSHRAQAPNICRQHNQINEEKKKNSPRTHQTVLLNQEVNSISKQQCVHSTGGYLAA